MLANHHSREWMVYNKTDEHVLTIIISIDIRVANNFLVFGHASQAVEARESANRCDLGVVGEFPWFLESCIYIDSYIHHMHIQSHISHKDIIIRLLYPHLMTYINPISSHIIRYHQVSSDIIRYHQISSDITWYHLIPFDIIWYHLILIILLTESTSFFSLSTVSQERQRQQSALQRSNAAAEASASAAKAEAEQKVRRRFSPVVGMAMSWDINIYIYYIYI